MHWNKKDCEVLWLASPPQTPKSELAPLHSHLAPSLAHQQCLPLDLLLLLNQWERGHFLQHSQTNVGLPLQTLVGYLFSTHHVKQW